MLFTIVFTKVQKPQWRVEITLMIDELLLVMLTHTLTLSFVLWAFYLLNSRLNTQADAEDIYCASRLAIAIPCSSAAISKQYV